MFVAREGELARFRAFLESGQNAMLIYGMRRTGKTALIHKALESWEGKSIYYQCSQESAKVNLDAIVEEYIMVFGDSNRHFETFPDFFSFLALDPVSRNWISLWVMICWISRSTGGKSCTSSTMTKPSVFPFSMDRSRTGLRRKASRVSPSRKVIERIAFF